MLEKTNLHTMLEQVITQLQPRLDKIGATADISHVPTDIYVMADQQHLSNVFYNLLDNALKYADRDIRISVEAVAAGGIVTITLTDNGMGIPERYKTAIFEPYFRVPEMDQYKVKGYGLGLSYAKEIIELHKGSIRLLITDKPGATFEITLNTTDA